MKNPAFLHVDRLKDLNEREKYAKALFGKLFPINEVGDFGATWDMLSSRLMETALTTPGIKGRRNEDWFDENDGLLRTAFDKHRNLLRQYRRGGSGGQIE